MPPFEHLFPHLYKTLDVSAGSTTETTPLHNGFKLPIEYIAPARRFSIPTTVIADLELVNLTENGIGGGCGGGGGDGSGNSPPPIREPLYYHLLQPTNEFSKGLVGEWTKYFTNDVEFLKQTQFILKTPNIRPPTAEGCSAAPAPAPAPAAMLDIWREVKYDTNFVEKYNYIDWKPIEFLNNSEIFLHVLSLYNVVSPALSLLLPVILLIVPFFILKIRGIPITFSLYLEILKDIARHNIIGKTLSQIANKMSFENIVYVGVSLLLYVLQTYQNTICCIRFYHNTHKIRDYLRTTNDFLKHSIAQMTHFVEIAGSGAPAYVEFCAATKKHVEVLATFSTQLTESAETSLCRGGIGKMMKLFYQLHKNPEYENSIQYAIGFEGYILHLEGIRNNISRGFVSMCKFQSPPRRHRRRHTRPTAAPHRSTTFRQQYYPSLKDENPVKNTVELNKNITITGPNASGKTTILKTTILNILFTQQFGCGFYSEGSRIEPYTHIHSYLNIPDTSGRESLFQAEAMRCKEILNAISSAGAGEARHFCIFDELYSGTNPVEAVKTARAFLRYLSKYENVHFMITTHYIDICAGAGAGAAGATTPTPARETKNAQMYVEEDEDTGKLTYKYKLINGISNIHGAAKVLEAMEYPKELLENL
jgi:hypothetical protein